MSYFPKITFVLKQTYFNENYVKSSEKKRLTKLTALEIWLQSYVHLSKYNADL